jgi:hypothetical protein
MGTLKVDQSCLENFEMGHSRRMEISLNDRVKSEEVLQSQGGEEYPT